MDQAQQLRNIIKLNNQKLPRVARVITVTSGKGGVGKSSTAINLAIQLSKTGKKVIILDADFGLANIEVMFGVMPKYNLSDVIYKGKNIKDIITEAPMGIKFVSGGSGIEGLANLDKIQISHLINGLVELDHLADIIIIDTGAGISDSVLEFVIAGTEIILVTTPEPTSLTDSYSLLKALNNHQDFIKQETSVKVVANRINSVSESKNLFEKLNLVSNKFLSLSLTHLGEIPQDDNVARAIMQQQPVSMKYPNTKAAKAYEILAMNLLNEQSLSMPFSRRGITNLFSNYMNRLHR